MLRLLKKAMLIVCACSAWGCATADNAWECEPTRNSGYVWSFECRGGMIGSVHRQLLCDSGGSTGRAHCTCKVDQRAADARYVELLNKNQSEVIELANTACGWRMAPRAAPPSTAPTLPAEGQ